MLVLGVDTSLGAASVALVEDSVPLGGVARPMLRGHQEAIAVIARDVFASAGRRPREIDRIGVVVGPGSFTGLRVGLAFAKGVALALARPCVGVGSFEALIASAPASGLTATMIDAGRGRVHVAFSEDGAVLGPPETLDLDGLGTRLRALCVPVRLLGPGALLLAPPPGGAAQPLAYPDPLVVAAIAAAAVEPFSPPAPLYLRPADAKTRAERGLS